MESGAAAAKQDVIDLEPIYRRSAVLRVLRPGLDALCGRFLKFDRFAADMARWERMCEGRDSPFGPAVEGLNLKVEVANREAIHAFDDGTRPLVVLSNHPFGAVEAVAIGQLFDESRYHLKLMATEMLRRIRPLRPRLIAVNSFARRERPGGSNLGALRSARQHLKTGGALLVFPGGRVSHFRWRPFRVTDPDWTTQAVRLARRSGANVLLVHVAGANSWRFQLAGAFHPFFRTLLLLREFYRRADRMSVRLALKAVPHDAPVLAAGSEESAIAALRELTYSLRA